MPLVPSYHYMLGPVTALLAVILLILLCRWTFGTGSSAVLSKWDQRRRNYGLLVPVAFVPTFAGAEQLRLHLADNGVRATIAVSSGPRLGMDVLVFPQDAEAAHRLLSSYSG